MKYEWRKAEKQIYLPKKIEIQTIPNYKFISLSGHGNPNSAHFSEQISALYILSYALRMKLKKGELGEPFEYTVYPLEGVWTSEKDPGDGPLNKDELIYQIMIRQPDRLTEEDFLAVVEPTFKKKQNPYIKDAKFIEYEEGRIIQTTHLGPYDDEAATFAKMHEFMEKEQLHSTTTMGQYIHREIYLSDPRKIEPAKQKTVLRYKLK
ncbi:GyrI-like domain-containing protein [Enterococcus xiangfangensis]|uniref:GyrI-like domain-containing protein n=1 Tax=Enterococcus xiangfangensis TaxID=1296537 RepID=A0ABU3FCN6_9ENTE|nr:GyrI-like domain-containing protein [Enterococcus xiangfangensis]MDT2760426.1 GyrI-like domain-containing protein [Enterococcus xiangfangensis]